MFTIETTQKFNEANFLNDVKNCNFRLKTDDPNENYDFLTYTFINIVNNYALLKKKFIRENQAPFLTRNLRKKIYTRSRFRNKFCKNATKENEKLYKKQRNKCVTLRRKCIKEYFRNKSHSNIVTNIFIIRSFHSNNIIYPVCQFFRQAVLSSIIVSLFYVYLVHFALYFCIDLKCFSMYKTDWLLSCYKKVLR